MDPLLAEAKMVLQSHRPATAHAALASTGILNLKPGSTNTVPESVRFSLDVRSPADSAVEALEAQIVVDFEKTAAGEGVGSLNESVIKGRPCRVRITTDSGSPAVRFHPESIKAVTEAAASVLGPDPGELTQEMVSGAGHDSIYTSKHVPTSMMFVSYRAGVSHNPTKYTSPENRALGVQVLFQSVLGFDRMRAERRVTWSY